jgi:putative ABC transport system permease protein
MSESLSMAVSVLVTNKLRSLLSVLGITIGIYCIILVYTLVHSLERNIRSSFDAFGADVVFIQKWPWDQMGFDYPWWKYLARPVVTIDEQRFIESQASDRISASAFAFALTGKTIQYGAYSADNVDVFSVTYDYNRVQKVDIAEGRYFTRQESEAGRPVVLIGAVLAEKLFPKENPLGKKIRLMKQQCTVIGVLNREGQSLINSSFDERAIIPLQFARTVANIRSEAGNPQIMVKAAPGIALEEAMWEVNAIMRAKRRIKPHGEETFAVNKMSMITDNISALFGQLNAAGTIIGLFALLVGCFGVANIMFVSVKERTQQIGIQKALGARDYFIVSQFLTEAIILCVLGGLLGLLLVYLSTLGANYLLGNMNAGLTLGLSANDAMTGLLVSAGIGLIAGILPALQAARMNPVDAMRAR